MKKVLFGWIFLTSSKAWNKKIEEETLIFFPFLFFLDYVQKTLNECEDLLLEVQSGWRKIDQAVKHPESDHKSQLLSYSPISTVCLFLMEERWREKGRYQNEDFTIFQQWISFFRYFTNITVQNKSQTFVTSKQMNVSFWSYLLRWRIIYFTYLPNVTNISKSKTQRTVATTVPHW